MNLKQMATRGRSLSPPQNAVPDLERCLLLLVEGAALNMPEIDAPAYRLFRESMSAMAREIPDRLSEDGVSATVESILKEFETYRNGADAALRERQAGWQALGGTLLRELLGKLGIDPGSASAAPLMEKIGVLSTGGEIQAFRALLQDFLHPGGIDETNHKASSLTATDLSTANDNAAGLRGGGAAQEHLGKIINRGGTGFVVIFRLSCLDVIGERFGLEAVHDSLMAVSAFLTQSLRNTDAIYHWSDSSLLGILDSPASEQILTAAMQRIVNSNRDITIQIGNRNVMLRIPMTFELTPIASFSSAEDLLRLSPGPASRH
jgi:GGDEF domain-containing protein